MAKRKMDDAPTPKAFPEMGERLRRIRESTGLGSAAFATMCHISPTNWSNYESGYSIPWQTALKIVAKMPWVTTDYIYLGTLSGVEMARKVGALPPERD